ncbi:MAG: EamA family transporter [Candidatus Hermodarchaeota archaeon]
MSLFGLGEVAALFGAALFGLSNIIYRSQKENVDSVTINSLKTWGAVVFFLGLVILLGLVNNVLNMSLITLILLCLSIIIGAGIGDLIYLKGQELAGVSRAFPIAMSFPLITYILELIFFRTPFQLNKGLGILIIVLGVAFISRSSLDEDNPPESTQNSFFTSSNNTLGIILAILAALLWAIAVLVLQLGLTESEPISANLVRTIAASLFLIPIFVFNYQKGEKRLPSRRTTIIVLIAGFFGMSLGTFFYVAAVKLSGASTTAALSATSPLFTLPLAMFFLKEKFSLLVVLGTILTVLGVLILVF